MSDVAKRYYNQAAASNEASKAFMDKAKMLLSGTEREFYLSQGHFLAGIASVYTKLAEERAEEPICHTGVHLRQGVNYDA